MTVYYNPKTRKPHPWVVMAPVVVPVILTMLIMYFGNKRLEIKVQEEKRKAAIDVFEKF